MPRPNLRRALRWLTVAGLVPLLAGCGTILLNAPGDVAAQQGRLIQTATWLMLIVIVPVIVMTLLFAWRYREGNKDAKYTPDWDHSTKLELVIWAVPLLIIIALGAITWISTHLLDPYRPLDRIAPGREIPEDVEPLVVEVVALDWKWLFVYPEEGVAAVNELAIPVDRPVRFRITSDTAMNAFYVPALAGMIYAMPGMETTLHGVMNQAGEYEGFSSNYSGAGFSHMRFQLHGVDQAGYDAWIAKAKGAGATLDRARYAELAVPSEKDGISHFSTVDDTLFHAIVNMCVEPGQRCMDATMRRDAQANARVHGLVPADDTHAEDPRDQHGSHPGGAAAPHDPNTEGGAAHDGHAEHH